MGELYGFELYLSAIVLYFLKERNQQRRKGMAMTFQKIKTKYSAGY